MKALSNKLNGLFKPQKPSKPKPSRIGEQTACRYCGHDIEFHGRESGWIDRGAGRQCLTFKDRKSGEFVHPKTKHAPPVKGGA